LDGFNIIDEDLYCEIQKYTDGKKVNEHGFRYNIFLDSIKYEELISKTIDKINSLPCIIYVENDIIEILSKIKTNRFLFYLSYFKNDNDIKINVNVTRINFAKGLYQFICIHKQLENYEFKKMAYKFCYMTPKEIEDRNKEYEKLLAMNPHSQIIREQIKKTE
jgi:hypothetical protein